MIIIEAVRKKVFYGWWIVVACLTIVGYGGGTFFFGFSVFFNAFITEFGWSRAATSAAFSLASLEGGLEGPILGPLVDKYGPRKLMLIGLTLVGAGFVLLTFINSLLTFYLVFLILAVGANTAIGLAPSTAVAQWFVRKRTLAFGILSAGFSIGGGVMVPILGWLVSGFGWRVTVVIIGIMTWFLGLPLASLVRHKPEQYGYLPDGDTKLEDSEKAPIAHLNHEGFLWARRTPQPEVNLTLGQALRTRAWWALSLAFAARNLSLSAVVAHQVPILVDRGFDAQTAANLLGLVAIMGLPARLTFGFLGDVFPKRPLIASAFLFQAVALVVLMGASTTGQVFLFTLLMGLSWGGIPVVMSLRAEYFGRAAFASIGGFMQTVVTLGSMTGPFFAGWVFDITKSYQIAFLVFAGACLVGAFLVLLATPPNVTTPKAPVPSEVLGGKTS